jgi:general stress protein 26
MVDRPTTLVQPVTELDARYSDPDSTPVTWDEALSEIREAEIFWITTVRDDGRPHVTPLIAVWHDHALHFCTGPSEQKAKNLATNRHVTLTTGCNTYASGLDVMIDGEAARVTDDGELQAIAEELEASYGSDWHFDVVDGEFHHEDGEGVALVFRVDPVTAHSFRRGEFSQTRHRFSTS